MISDQVQRTERRVSPAFFVEGLLMVRRGYSLIELLLVLAIVAVVAAIAAPRYGSAMSRYAAESAARRIVADLDQARELAKSASGSYVVNFQSASATYDFGPVGALVTAPTVQVVRASREPYGVALAGASFGGDAAVVFNGFGVPDSGGSVQVKRGTREYIVTLSATTGKSVATLVN